MGRLGKLTLMGGLQNVLQVGGTFPLSVLATLYFTARARFSVRTPLDVVLVLYVITGTLSFFIGIALIMIEGAGGQLLLNCVKSFLVFLTLAVYFGTRGVSIEDFFDAAMFVIVLTSAAALVSYWSILTSDPLSLYRARGAISWLPGWPQRWVMFPLIGHFVYLGKYDATRKPMHLVLCLMLLLLVLLSATRSAVLGVLAGHLVLSVLSRRDFIRSAIVLAFAGVFTAVYFDALSTAFRYRELADYTEIGSVGSVGYRFESVWPAIVESLGVWRLPFGWGHVGIAYIPEAYFPRTNMLGGIPGERFGSAESQYMDVLLRQGVIGLTLLAALLVMSMVYAYRMSKIDERVVPRALWKASLGWQFAILLHGITVETLRFPLFALFFFLFIGILSRDYAAVREARAAGQRGEG